MIGDFMEVLDLPDGVFQEFFEYIFDSLVIDTRNRIFEEFVEYCESNEPFINKVRDELKHEFIILYTGGFIEQ